MVKMVQIVQVKNDCIYTISRKFKKRLRILGKETVQLKLV